ncbi:mRNA surveillance protein pelota [Candidatus Bathyarchaeota archaeon]|nr:MAG: mRNA surveillance protein pelota [Candidatus Bathyarchaeota archaeon]
MRLLKKDDKHGLLALLPEDLDDLWALYAVIEPGDLVRARTRRERRVEGAKSRGKRVPISLCIQVEKKALDVLMGRLRLLGVIRRAPAGFEDEEGKHHTLDVRPGTPVEVVKEGWSSYQLRILERALRERPRPLLVACLDDEDYCIALVGLRDVEVLAEGENSSARELGIASKEDALRPFFREALSALREAWEAHRKPVAVIGPSMERDMFVRLLRSEEPSLAREIVAVRAVSTGGLPGIYEALRAGVLSKALSEARMIREAEAVRELLSRLGRGDGRVAYGLEDVMLACSCGAVEVLLVADSLLLDLDEEARAELEELMMEVEEKNGRVMIVSSKHEAGRNLLSLGGVAALLRFPWART